MAESVLIRRKAQRRAVGLSPAAAAELFRSSSRLAGFAKPAAPRLSFRTRPTGDAQPPAAPAARSIARHPTPVPNTARTGSAERRRRSASFRLRPLLQIRRASPHRPLRTDTEPRARRHPAAPAQRARPSLAAGAARRAAAPAGRAAAWRGCARRSRARRRPPGSAAPAPWWRLPAPPTERERPRVQEGRRWPRRGVTKALLASFQTALIAIVTAGS